MAIKSPLKNPFKGAAKPLPDPAHAPNWRTHPDLLAYRARLESARDQLPTLATALATAEAAYHAADDASGRAELATLAGQPLPEGVTSLEAARQTRDAAKQAYAVARFAHADVAREHADLEARAQETEEAIRAQVGQQMRDEFMALLDAQKQALDAAVAAQEAVQAYQHQLQQAFPGFIAGDPAFDVKLGLGIGPIDDLRRGTPMQPNGVLDRWQDRYAQLSAQRSRPITPLSPEQR